MKYDILVENWKNYLKQEDASINTTIVTAQAANLEEIQEAKKRKRANVVKSNKSGDRCTRIAKRKYDVWPSAYASGAVVRCRQGKIWKGVSENATNEEIDTFLLLEKSDPKVGTGKKPKDSDRRLYTDENPNDTVSVKFSTVQDIKDTLSKESFKSKSHARQSQIINLIHQRVRVAHERAKEPEVKSRLKKALDYAEERKEASKEKTQEMKEGLHDTSWENEEGDKITLMDLLNATEDIPVEEISVEKLKPYLLTWDGDEDKVKVNNKIDSADLQYPILIFVDNGGEFISIIDGHHRAQQAVRKGLEIIKAKVIPINSLPKDIRKVFSRMGKQEKQNNQLNERCWKGYTQKGMKTMFGKRYPNCVKIKKEQIELEEIEVIEEEWSDKYKRSIDCKNPKGFSQKAHCQGKKKK